ncbi:MAG: type II toxin-antitoxin system RelE/ParE family toxin [Proteobacteria bacterium]|nr:type II toxin-antitoxin system RelE/ParE family toxin [Pseudomonadota bacterium]
MVVNYRQLFLRDLKKLKKQPVYNQVFHLAFNTVPEIENIMDLSNVKSMKGFPGRYRIRIGEYRLGFELNDSGVEMMRVMHRKDFYRYFP